jgi:caspase domain-containing protein
MGLAPRIFAVAACLGIFSGAARAEQSSAPARHAVVIGINEYADSRIPALRYAESDAKAVAALLRDPKIGAFPVENVKLLLGEQASPSNIKAALYALRKAGKDDLVVVFFSGHGTKEGDEAFWVTQNAASDGIPATALSNTEIRKYLAMIPSERMVVLLDCCYAASTVKKSLGDPRALFGNFAGKGRVTIAGSADNQEALEMPDARAGVFTHFLVAGLGGDADTNTDGVVTFEELWDYLGRNVRKASILQGGLHEPVLISEGGITPQFLLTFNPKAARASAEGVSALREMLAKGEITDKHFAMGVKLLGEPAIAPLARARRDVFVDVIAGRVSPKYIDALLREAGSAHASPAAPAPGGRPTVSVVPFSVLGSVKQADAGRILAEKLLGMLSAQYQVIDQGQLRHFLEQDDLTVAGLVEQIGRGGTKGLTKAVKLKGVQYLVVGSITGSPDGSLSVTARLCDWQTGSVQGSRVGQISAADWSELDRRVPLLAALLMGTVRQITSDGEGDAAEVRLRDLTAFRARALQVEALVEQLRQLRQTLVESHPRVAKARDELDPLSAALAIEAETELAFALNIEKQLAKLYQPSHPQRKLAIERVAYVRKVRDELVSAARALLTQSARIAAPAGGETEALDAAGYQAAIEASVGVPLSMGPSRAALESLGQVRDAGTGFFLPKAGPRGEAAWVFADGRIVVAGKQSLSEAKTYSQLCLAWCSVAKALAEVSATLKVEEVEAMLDDRVQAYSPGPDQLQVIQVRARADASGWVLSWPDGRARWAEVVADGGGSRWTPVDILIDEKQVVSNTAKWPASAPLAIAFGEHSLTTRRCRGKQFCVRAFFTEPKGRIALYDQSGRDTATRVMASRSLASVRMPAPSEQGPPPAGGGAAEAMKLRGAMAAPLGTALARAPLLKALAGIGRSEDVGDAIQVDKPGQTWTAWVYLDGRVVIADRRGFAPRDNYLRLAEGWCEVAAAAAGTSAGLDATKVYEQLLEGLELYTPEPDQLQVLFVRIPADAVDWVLSCPKSPGTWARLMHGGGGTRWAPCIVHIDDQNTLRSQDKTPPAVDVSRVAPGEHKLATSRMRGNFFVLEAFYGAPQGHLALYDRGNRNMATRAAYSRPLASLSLPPEAAGQPETPASDGSGKLSGAQLNTWLMMAQSLHENKRYAKTVEYCRKVIDAAPYSPEADTARKLETKAKAAMEGHP